MSTETMDITSHASPVMLHRHGAVAVITMNRPERANVLNAQSSPALIDAVLQVSADVAAGAVRAVLLKARGAPFCAGGDIAEMVAAGAGLGAMLDRFIPPLNDAIMKLAQLPVPVISAVHGAVGGGGIGLALCADIVLASEAMKLRGGYTAIGLTPDVGASWFLTRRAGPARAKRIFMTNELVSATQALAWGIVDEVLPEDALTARALALAEQLAAGATGAMGRVKTLVDGAPDRSLAEQMALERRGMVDSGRGPEAAEGVAAFLAKRPPVFPPPTR